MITQNKKGRVTAADLMVANLLKNKRISSGLTQHELAKVIGVTIQQFQKYEKGVNRLSSGKLYQLAGYLNVSIEYFFNKSNVNAVDDLKYTTDKEITLLIKSFKSIQNKTTRQSILNIVQTLANV